MIIEMRSYQRDYQRHEVGQDAKQINDVHYSLHKASKRTADLIIGDINMT